MVYLLITKFHVTFEVGPRVELQERVVEVGAVVLLFLIRVFRHLPASLLSTRFIEKFIPRL